MHWTAPEIWPSTTVFIIGGGPSLKAMDLIPLHERPVIGVNNAFELGPWVDVTFFGDKNWFEHNYKKLLAHPSLIATCNQWSGFGKFDRIKQLKKNNRGGLFWKSKDTVCWNNNSGAAAINLAMHLGANRIVLLGFDMKVDKVNGYRGGHNWHPHHEKLNSIPRTNIYEQRFIPGFKRMADDLITINSLNGRRVEILNATPGSVLDVFPKVTLEAVL